MPSGQMRTLNGVTRLPAALEGRCGQATQQYLRGDCTVPCLNGKQGTELADVIVNKIKEAVDKVAFK